jgi:uncharacterized damage-inducible protein DinB
MTGDAVLTTLRELLRYNIWATLRLLDHCAVLPAETLSLTVPGTAGTIGETFVHIAVAQDRYLERITGAERWSVREGMDVPLAELRDRVEGHGATWERVLDDWASVDVTLPGEPEHGYPEIRRAQHLLLLQTVHHGDDHRTHIGTILGAHGLPVPDIDAWSYWPAVDHPRT